MKPEIFLRDFIDPQLAYLQRLFPARSLLSHEARMQLLCHAGQETMWLTRLQSHGPAHSFWQFEEGGGVAAILGSPRGSIMIAALCADLCIPPDKATIFQAMIWNDALALGMARIRLFIDPGPLPKLWDIEAAWAMYIKDWGPGKPDRNRWNAVYAQSRAAISAAIVVAPSTTAGATIAKPGNLGDAPP